MTAIKGQGGQLAIGSAISGSAVVVTAATAANPVVLTATNTLSNGDIIVASAFTSGPTNLNNRAFVAAAVSGSSVTLKGEDGSLNAAYSSSGGSLQKWTMLNVSQGTNITGFDGQANDVDATHLQSQAEEVLQGIPRFGNVTMELLLAAGDTGQARMRLCQRGQLLVPFSLTLSDGSVSAWMGFVKQFSFTGVNPDGVLKANATLRVTNFPAWFA
jgi:hypothetical protein